MELTIHGSERIQGRTKMLAQDVLSLISAGAVVELGHLDGFEFLLFYSPPDGCTKIAIVANKRTLLISIWENEYFLPNGVRKVTPKQNRKAHRAMQTFLFNRIKAQK